jgi:serine/threonine protein kinase
MKSWIAAHGLSVRGIPTASAMALIEDRRWRVLRDSFLFMEDLTDCSGLDRYVKAAFPGKGKDNRIMEKRAFINTFATIVRSLHERGIFHKDLKASNILVKETGESSWRFHFIDLDGVSFQKGPLRSSKSILNLIQINASIPSQISSTDRLRFLHVYMSEPGLTDRGKAFARKVIAGSKKRAGAWPYARPHPQR